MEFKYITSKGRKYLPTVKLSLGLGSTSLIAACGGLGDVGQYFITFGSDDPVDPTVTQTPTTPTTPPPPPPPPPPASISPPPPPKLDPLAPDEAPIPQGYQWYGPVSSAPGVQGINRKTTYRKDISQDARDVDVSIAWKSSGSSDFDLFTERKPNGVYANVSKWYHIDGNYDLTFGKVYERSADGSRDIYKILIYWNAPQYETNPSLKNNRLEVSSGNAGDVISLYDLININNNYDYELVIRAYEVSYNNKINVGAFYILWDVDKLRHQQSESVTLNDNWLSGPDNTNFKVLTVYGGSTNEQLNRLPLFLAIGGRNSRDMLISSPKADYATARTIAKDTGAVYLIWDVAAYSNTADKHIIFDMAFASNAAPNHYNVLSIFGANAGDNISHVRGAFKIGGDKDEYELIVTSSRFDYGGKDNIGAIYIVWDVGKYAGAQHTINLADPSTFDHGVLSVHGSYAAEALGSMWTRFISFDGNNTYNMVIRSPLNDSKGADSGSIYLLWDVGSYSSDKNKIINVGNLSSHANAGYLEIKGALAGDKVGEYGPTFLNITGKVDSYDMIIRAPSAHYRARGISDQSNAGAIYIVWDITKYEGDKITINSLGRGSTTDGVLTLTGNRDNDNLGKVAPSIISITDDGKKSMMVVAPEDQAVYQDEGIIYILWDIVSYASQKNKTIRLGFERDTDAGFLEIRGSVINEKLGAHKPELLNLTNQTDNYDMVLRSPNYGFNKKASNEIGAIFILWDVGSYSSLKYKGIRFGYNTFDQEASAGGLRIYGKDGGDKIGSYKPEFLQIGGKDDNYDLVITSVTIKFNGDKSGAIYVLWDIADYYSSTTRDITLGDKSTAPSGLLTIYGKGKNATLGDSKNSPLYDKDSSGNKILTDIDRDGTKDIVFRDKDYTYILFGDEVADTGRDNKVDSKTIDLAKIETALAADTAAFFDYDFSRGSASAAVNQTDRVGYRFADRNHSNLAKVQEAYDAVTGSASAPAPASPLTDFGSDTDLFV